MRQRMGLILGIWVALAMTACGASATSLCSDACDCEGCSDREYDDCVDDIEDDERRADDRDCLPEFDDMLDCWDAEQECRGDDFHVDGCDPEQRDYAKCMD